MVKKKVILNGHYPVDEGRNLCLDSEGKDEESLLSRGESIIISQRRACRGEG